MPAPQKANLAPEALSNSHVLQKVRWENGRGSDRHGAQQMSPSFPFAHLGSVPNAFPTEATGPLSRRSVCSRTKPCSSPRKRLLLVRSACQTVSKHFTQIMSPCKPTTTYAVDTIVLIPVSRKLRLRQGRGPWPRCCACCGGARPLPSGVRVNLTSVGPRWGSVNTHLHTREPAKGIHQPPLSLGFHGDQAWLGDSTVAYVVSGISRFLGHMPQ